jgi:hypothetical protein
MFKAVRVILSLIPDGFLSGLSRARGGFSGFMGFLKNGVSTGQMLFTGLNQAVQLVERGINAVRQAVGWLNDTFLEGAMSQEKFEITLGALVGDSEKAEQILGSLHDRIIEYGIDADNANRATVQFTMGLKGMTGDVDPDQLETLLDYMQRITTVRDDIVGGEQAVGRGIIEAMGGNFTTLTRLLDIPLTKLQGLSEETQAFVNGVSQATDQQLGQVTALGGKTEANAEDAIAAIGELLEAAGINQDVVEAVKESNASMIDQVEARWEDFTNKVGGTFLPYLEEGLEKFIVFLDEHQEEIDAFAEALGRLAGEGFEELSRKIENIDWKKVGEDAREFAEDIRYIVEQIANFLEKLDELSDWEGWEFLFGGGGFGTPQDFMANQGQQGQKGWNLQEAIGLDPNLPLLQAIGQRSQQNQEASQQTPSQGPQEVTVRVVVDGEQNIRAAVDNAARAAASEEIGAFTDEVVRSTGAGH